MFVLISTFAAMNLQAQTLERQVIGAAGTFQTASWGSLSSTTGESITTTAATSSVVLTQGFQQPLQTDLVVYEIPTYNITVMVFPVPASGFINVAINSGKHYSVKLFDMLGRQLKLPVRDLSSGMETRYTFDLNSIANGTYLMLINDEHNSQVKAIKFTKIN